MQKTFLQLHVCTPIKSSLNLRGHHCHGERGSLRLGMKNLVVINLHFIPFLCYFSYQEEQMLWLIWCLFFGVVFFPRFTADFTDSSLSWNKVNVNVKCSSWKVFDIFEHSIFLVLFFSDAVVSWYSCLTLFIYILKEKGLLCKTNQTWLKTINALWFPKYFFPCFCVCK